jgi:hypothetical protein
MRILRIIGSELKEHTPFTILGAISGIAVMALIVFTNASTQISNTLFYTLHPIHIVASSLVTTAMYQKYSHQKIWIAILIGYIGTIGVATLSDAIIPYLGGALLGAEMEFHIPFIELEVMPIIGIPKWIVINSAAIIGIAIGIWKPITKFPHSVHVLLSTWASLFYFTAFGIAYWLPLLPLIFVFLFLAVLIPCCMSDIIFPLLFTRPEPLQP